MTNDEPVCVMCEKAPCHVNLQCTKLINALLCWDCANKLQNLIEHCDLDWSFTLGINQKLLLADKRKGK